MRGFLPSVFSLLIALCSTPGQGALARETSATVYDPNPDHIYNRLFEFFYSHPLPSHQHQRLSEPDSREELDLPVGVRARFVMDEDVFQEAVHLLKEFLSPGGSDLTPTPLQKVLLQRDLWAVFDLLQENSADFKRRAAQNGTPQLSFPDYTSTEQTRREALCELLASAIQRLLLTRQDIESLPDTLPIGKSIPVLLHDFGKQQRDVPVAEGYFRSNAWMEVRSVDPMVHNDFVADRSVFRVFVRLPAGAERIAARLATPGRVRELPVGAQLMLIRQMICLDDAARPVVIPLVESIQIRASSSRNAEHMAAEFEMSRRLLLGSVDFGLRPVVRGEERPAGYSGLGYTLLSNVGYPLMQTVFPQTCFGCHGADRGRLRIRSRAITLDEVPWSDGVEGSAVDRKMQREDYRELLRRMGNDRAL